MTTIFYPTKVIGIQRVVKYQDCNLGKNLTLQKLLAAFSNDVKQSKPVPEISALSVDCWNPLDRKGSGKAIMQQIYLNKPTDQGTKVFDTKDAL